MMQLHATQINRPVPCPLPLAAAAAVSRACRSCGKPPPGLEARCQSISCADPCGLHPAPTCAWCTRHQPQHCKPYIVMQRCQHVPYISLAAR